MQNQNEIQSIKITDIDISFGQMVILMIKFSFASIPALFFIAMISGIIALLFSIIAMAIK